jgi:hypothetical protein
MTASYDESPERSIRNAVAQLDFLHEGKEPVRRRENVGQVLPSPGKVGDVATVELRGNLGGRRRFRPGAGTMAMDFVHGAMMSGPCDPERDTGGGYARLKHYALLAA